MKFTPDERDIIHMTHRDLQDIESLLVNLLDKYVKEDRDEIVPMTYDLRRALYHVREAISTVVNMEDAP